MFLKNLNKLDLFNWKYLLTIGVIVLVIIGVYLQRPSILDNTDSTIVLKAPKECKIGELIELDASASDATCFTWKVVPETPNFKIIEQGKKALFCSGSPGKYLFILAAAKRDTVDIVIHEITVKGSNVNPVPPVNNFNALVKSWLPSSPDPVILEKLAVSFERVASAQHNDVESLVATTAASNRVILNGNLEVYKPFLMSFSNYLTVELKDAPLEKHVEVWFRFAEALRACKEATSLKTKK